MRHGPVVTIVVGIGVVFLVVPTLIVTAASFSDSTQIQFPPEAFTLRWYAEMFANADVWRTLLNSSILGVCVVVLDVLVAVPAMLAVNRYRLRGSALASAVLNIGLATPLIVTALAFLVVFTQLRIAGDLLPISVALAVVNLPFMLWAVGSSVASLDPALEESASTLGAPAPQRFLLVVVPQLAPGIVTGSLLVFTLTITDFLISVILTDVQSETLPVYVYSGLRSVVSPGLAAVSVLFVVVAALVFTAVLRFGRIDAFLKRNG